jgi:hypothetical protein
VLLRQPCRGSTPASALPASTPWCGGQCPSGAQCRSA